MNSQTDDMYSLMGRNAQDWLGAAKSLKLSADLVLNHLLLVDSEKLDTALWNVRGGHGISSFAKRVVSLNPSEINLLERLEEHIVWAGRYPIPKLANTYSKATEPYSRRKFQSRDPKLIDHLFERFTEILIEEWRKQEGLR